MTPVKTEEEVKNIFGDEGTLEPIKLPIEVEEVSIASFVCKFKMCCVTATYEIEYTALAPLTDMSCLYRKNIRQNI